MGVVHGLEGDARVIAIEVTILNQVFDGVNHLLRSVMAKQSGMVAYLLQGVRLLKTCF